jgi:hypothetical protein
MIEMSKVLELMQIEDPKISIINCFPLRQSIIPKYIRIDTTTLIHLFYDELKKKLNKKRKELLDNVMDNSDDIWDSLFRTGKKIFNRKNYSFNYQIQTDGLSTSVLLMNNQEMQKKKINPKHKIKSMKNQQNFKIHNI